MKILLAIDSSPSSDAALREVSQRPLPPRTQVRLIMVERPVDAGLLRTGVQTVFDELFKTERLAARRRLHRAAARLQQTTRALIVTPLLRHGDPSQIILNEAARWGADLIVVGSRGFGLFKRILFGSVSLAVAANAPCSVQIVRPSAPVINRGNEQVDVSRGSANAAEPRSDCGMLAT
jgi:nucleotide-binding universal stress UspA family protein